MIKFELKIINCRETIKSRNVSYKEIIQYRHIKRSIWNMMAFFFINTEFMKQRNFDIYKERNAWLILIRRHILIWR